jgi:hypothetical protein
MSNPQNSTKIILSKWKGLEQRPDQSGLSNFIDALNVELFDGNIGRCKGRTNLLVGSNNIFDIVPNKILYSTSDYTSLVDYTYQLTDGDQTTIAIANVFSTSGAVMYIGTAIPVRRIFISVKTANNVSATLIVKYHNGNDGTWTNVQNLSDGTSVGGVTLAQSGFITFSTPPTSNFVAPFRPYASFTTYPGLTTLDLSPDLYWIQITTSTTLGTSTPTDLSEIYVQNDTTVDYGMLGSAGVIEYTSGDGSKSIISVSDLGVGPQLFEDNWAQISGFQLNSFFRFAGLIKYEINRNRLRVISIPFHLRRYTKYSKKITFAVFNGWLLGSGPTGHIWKYNGGDTADTLEALPGTDLQQQLPGAQGYLPFTPCGYFLEVYHNKLMIAGDPNSPTTFYGSMADNDITNIPSNATVGGPNVWPLNHVFSLPTEDGSPITGAAVINDRYVLFTKNSTWVFDEATIREVNGDIGCVAPGSIQKIDKNIFFLSANGIFITDSVNVSRISDKIDKIISEINWNSVEFCVVSAHDKFKHEYWLWLPVNGKSSNRVAVVFDYIKNDWRIVSNWYLFDDDSRLSISGMFDITAATSSTDSTGKPSIISVDRLGKLYQESSGENGSPAYAVFHQLSSQGEDGEEYSSFRSWYVNAGTDGGVLECIALRDGERFDQEINRRLNSIATNSEAVIKTINTQSSGVPSSGTQKKMSADPDTAYPITVHWPQLKKIKFSFGRNITKMQPCIHWIGKNETTLGSYTGYSSIGYTSTYIHDVQIEFVKKPGAR